MKYKKGDCFRDVEHDYYRNEVGIIIGINEDMQAYEVSWSRIPIDSVQHNSEWYLIENCKKISIDEYMAEVL